VCNVRDSLLIAAINDIRVSFLVRKEMLLLCSPDWLWTQPAFFPMGNGASSSRCGVTRILNGKLTYIQYQDQKCVVTIPPFPDMF
jgi:hypothetical protein